MLLIAKYMIEKIEYILDLFRFTPKSSTRWTSKYIKIFLSIFPMAFIIVFFLCVWPRE